VIFSQSTLDTVTEDGKIIGWTRYLDDFADKVEVAIEVDGKVLFLGKADKYREDLEKAGYGDGKYGFFETLPPKYFDGRIHTVSITAVDGEALLSNCPMDIQFENLHQFSPRFRKCHPIEPWAIGSIKIESGWLTIRGMALPPDGDFSAAKFSVNSEEFDIIDWGVKPDRIGERYFYFPGAEKSAFVLRKNISCFIADKTEELVLSYTPFHLEPGANRYHNYYVPLLAENYPVPETERIDRVIGSEDEAKYLLGGYTLSKQIENALEKLFSSEIQDFEHILDWGCGSGRLLRYLCKHAGQKTEIYGADVDYDNVNWCNLHLPDCRTILLNLMPPSKFEANFFDFIVGNSVLTHLNETTQFAWLKELRRISRPGAILFLTIQDVSDLVFESYSTAKLKTLLKQGFLSPSVDNAISAFIADPEYYRSAYHSHKYIKKRWSKYFDIISILPKFSNNHQDLVVLRCPD